MPKPFGVALLSAAMLSGSGLGATAVEYRAARVWWQAAARVIETGGGAVVFQLPAVDPSGKVVGALALACPSASPRGPFLQIPTSVLPAPMGNLGPEVRVLLGVNNRIMPAYLDGNRFLIYLREPHGPALRRALLESKDRLALGTSPDLEAVGRGEFDGRAQSKPQVDPTSANAVALKLDLGETEPAAKELFGRWRALGQKPVTISQVLRLCDGAAAGSGT